MFIFKLVDLRNINRRINGKQFGGIRQRRIVYSMISGVSSSRESGGAVMSVVEYIQEVLAELSRRHSPIALIAEYNNAIAVLTGRVKLTSGNFNSVISDLYMVIQLEQVSDGPDTHKIKEYTEAISKLKNSSV